MATIYSRREDYNGISASVEFVDGVGITDDEDLIQWFREHGYSVVEDDAEEAEEESNESDSDEDKPVRKRRTVTKDE